MEAKTQSSKGFIPHQFPNNSLHNPLQPPLILRGRKRGGGFTLIELLVVISIIGLLASVAMVALNSARQKAKDARVTSEFRQIHVAAEFDFDQNGNYAPDVGPGGSPRFVGTFMSSNPSGSFYCSTCVYDWQNWGSGCIIIDLYQTPTGPVIRRHCIYTPSCGWCTDF